MDNINIKKDNDSELVTRVKKSVSLELEKRKAMNVPIVRYDRKTGKIYHEMPDGSKIEVAAKLKRGSYSERVK